MGRRDIVEFLLQKGARIDLFCAAMMGQLDAVKAFLTLQPGLIDAKGPHGFSLHFHAQVGGEQAEKACTEDDSAHKETHRLGPPVTHEAHLGADYGRMSARVRTRHRASRTRIYAPP